MLRIKSLEVYGLAPISFEVADGECIAVQGPSGSGKTVLLRALADLDPAEGQILLDGAERGALSGPEWRKRVRYAAAEPGWWGETPREHFAHDAGLDKLVSQLGLKAAQLDQSIAQLSTGDRANALPGDGVPIDGRGRGDNDLTGGRGCPCRRTGGRYLFQVRLGVGLDLAKAAFTAEINGLASDQHLDGRSHSAQPASRDRTDFLRGDPRSIRCVQCCHGDRDRGL